MLTINRQKFLMAVASVPHLFAAPSSEIAAAVKKILEEYYFDGIDQILSADLDENGDIVGEFLDQVGARQIKKFRYKISEKEVSYGLSNPDEVDKFAVQAFSIFQFAKNCKKSIPCGNSCISKNKKCRKTPAPAVAAAVTATKAAIAAKSPATAPAAAPSAAKKTAKTAPAAAAPAAAAPTAAPAAPAAPAPKATKKTTKKASQKAAPPAPAPSTPAKPVKISTNQKLLDSTRQSIVAKVGQAQVDAAEKKLKKVLEKSSVYMKVPTSEVMGFIMDGGFKTAHELGGRPGAPPPGTGQGDYLNARARVEQTVLGISKKTAGRDRPKYAILASDDLNSQEHLDAAGAYGGITVQFKKSVKDRTTFTGADSFKSGIASPVNNPNVASVVPSTSRGNINNQSLNLNARQYVGYAAKSGNIKTMAEKLSPGGNAYLEAQVHGQLTLDDVEALHFKPRGAHDRPTKAIVDAAAAKGVKVYVNGKQVDPTTFQEEVPPLNTLLVQKAFLEGNIDTLSEIYQEASKATNDPTAKGKYPGADDIQAYLSEQVGFSEKPQKVKTSEFDALDPKTTHFMFRGVSAGGGKTAQKVQEQFLDDTLFIGRGVFGHGSYFAHASNSRNGALAAGASLKSRVSKAKNIALTYGGNSASVQNTAVIRAALSSDARIETSNRVKELQQQFRSKVLASAEKKAQAALKNGGTVSKVEAQQAAKVSAEIDKSFFPRFRNATNRLMGLYVEEVFEVGGTYSADSKTKKEVFSSSNARVLMRTVTRTKEVTIADAYPEIRSGLARLYPEKWDPVNQEITFSNRGEADKALDEAMKAVARMKETGYPRPPKAGDPNANALLAAATARADANLLLAKWDIRDDVISGRFATALGIDAIAVSQTTGAGREASQYINILNRSKLILDEQIYDKNTLKASKGEFK